jgi:hypothetical protein
MEERRCLPNFGLETTEEFAGGLNKCRDNIEMNRTDIDNGLSAQ